MVNQVSVAVGELLDVRELRLELMGLPVVSATKNAWARVATVAGVPGSTTMDDALGQLLVECEDVSLNVPGSPLGQLYRADLWGLSFLFAATGAGGFVLLMSEDQVAE